MDGSAAMDELPAPVVRRPPRGVAGRIRTVLVLGAITVAVLVVAYVVDQPVTGGYTKVTLSGAAAAAAPAVGQVPPDITATAIDGSAVSLSALKGHPVWLTFGASWCPDCRAEAADIQAAYAKHKAAGLQVVGVFNEGADTAASYAAKVGMTFPLVADPSGQILDAYRNLGLPTHYFISPDGTVRAVRIGRLSPADMEALIAQLLGG